jgi:hypothetical protein
MPQIAKTTARETTGPTAPAESRGGHSIQEAMKGDYLVASEIGDRTVEFRVRGFSYVSLRQRDGSNIDKPSFTGTIGDEERVLVLNRTALAKLLEYADTFEELVGRTLILGTQPTSFGPGIVIVGVEPPKTE